MRSGPLKATALVFETSAATLAVLLVSALLVGAVMVAIAAPRAEDAAVPANPDAASAPEPEKERFKSLRYLLRAGHPDAPVPEALAELARSEGFARFVALEDRRGEPWIVFGHANPADATAFLKAHGYPVRQVEMTKALPIDVEALLQKLTSFSSPRAFAAMLLVQALVMLLAGAFLLRWRIGRSGRLAGGRPCGAGRAVAWGAGFGAAAIALTSAIEWLQAAAGFPVEEQPWVVELIRPELESLPLVALVVLGGPLAEEVFFRGYAFGLLFERAGSATAYLASALLFSTAHFNPSATLVYVAYGLVLAFAYAKTGRLAAPIAAHVLINAFSVAVVLAAAGG